MCYFSSYCILKLLHTGVFTGRALAPAPFGVRKKWAFLLLINFSNLLANFREYILKIALTRSIFQPTMHQIAPPGPAGVPYSAPSDTLAGLRGAYF